MTHILWGPEIYDPQWTNDAEDSFSILDSFYHDLPDRHQRLFFQPLDFFPLHKLPLELRLMIWRATIPQRKIWLHPQTHRSHNYKSPMLHLPIISSIQACAESRQEIYRHLRLKPHSSKPICITKFDTIRFDFKLMIRIDAQHEELRRLLRQRRWLVSQVREVEVIVDGFSEMDKMLLWMSWHDIFLPFVRLDRLRLLVLAGEGWIEKCREQFEEVCDGCGSGRDGNKSPALSIEEI
ncbi:hypothetical protein BKA65DRAFT_485236 [Rhexocercosporidium sp. MPI-PUGE-AT-0058]|nr:hypothetical protein BKA65DRAFT_485236 [Rhexocercosporidium sp. MPI-PUGE-AT-0058]